MTTNVNWITAQSGNWLDPENTNWATVNCYGVYAIWRVGNYTVPPRYVRIGQGQIADRVQAHMRDATITQHRPLRFTFAAVNALQVDGVERYLAETMIPLVGHRFPDVLPIPVNLPRAA